MTKITELGNCLLFWATCKFIIFRWPPRPNWLHVGYCIGWPSKVAGKLKAWREIGFLKEPSSRMRNFFCKTQHIWFHKHKAYSQWQEIRSELLFQTTLDGKLWICFSKLCQSMYGIFGIVSECDLFYCRLINWLPYCSIFDVACDQW